MTDATRPLGIPRTAPRPLIAGESVADWRIVRPLARGGFGVVYEARHMQTQQPAALKLLHAHLTTSVEMLARFDREIQVIGRLHHPHIVQLVDAGFSADERPYLCMELLDGEELTAIIDRTRGLAPRVALAILEPLCDALAAAHALGIVHRDIKSSNVMRCADGRVVLLDFRIAKLSDALAPELTASHQSLGTPACMAPEQIQGQRADARTDLYALGGLLFHMLTGRTAFHDPSPTMSQYLHLHASRPRASAIADVSPRLDHVIARAMAIDPDDRWPDAPTFLAAAHAALRDTAVANAVTVATAGALLVTVTDRTAGVQLDATLLDDLEAVLPAAERYLSERGFTLAVDLGSSALFVAPGIVDEVAVARDLLEHLAARPHRDDRVQIGVGVHRDDAPFVGSEIQPCALLRPATWQMPEAIDGLWVSERLR